MATLQKQWKVREFITSCGTCKAHIANEFRLRKILQSTRFDGIMAERGVNCEVVKDE
ncbi:hypothetical protein PIB30_009151 [Stylosanthes scabra]|uniref:Uncharacterized protein n=1 Tax=Stylosanthes scabra TaxID=79078 RepID=A0ABU6X3W9_9FABA|nr:hypothetical protein [Stylosanthes scabra]